MAYAAAAHSMRAPGLSPPSRETSTTSRYPETWCSQCGRGFGPGNSGYSSCTDHADPDHKSLAVAVEALHIAVGKYLPSMVETPAEQRARRLRWIKQQVALMELASQGGDEFIDGQRLLPSFPSGARRPSRQVSMPAGGKSQASTRKSTTCLCCLLKSGASAGFIST